jgi:hypothetical protein
MMPGIGPRHDAGRKRTLTAAFAGGGATMAYVVVAASRFSDWEWVPLAVGLIIIIVIAVTGLAGRRGGRGRGGGLRGHGRDDGDRPAARRGAAIRSYLLSAPRLVVMTWAREVLRRARLGQHRPG